MAREHDEEERSGITQLDPQALCELPAAVVRKTVTETDMVLFSGITGDFAANHTDEEYMRATPYGTRQVHGALLVGFMSAAAARAVQELRPSGLVPVSLGYDRLRFFAPVFPGQTIEASHRFSGYKPRRRRATAEVTVSADGNRVARATHVVQWVAADDRSAGSSGSERKNS